MNMGREFINRNTLRKKIVDLDMDPVGQACEEVEERTGYHVLSHRHDYFGLEGLQRSAVERAEGRLVGPPPGVAEGQWSAPFLQRND